MTVALFKISNLPYLRNLGSPPQFLKIRIKRYNFNLIPVQQKRSRRSKPKLEKYGSRANVANLQSLLAFIMRHIPIMFLTNRFVRTNAQTHRQISAICQRHVSDNRWELKSSAGLEQSIRASETSKSGRPTVVQRVEFFIYRFVIITASFSSRHFRFGFCDSGLPDTV